MESRAFWQYSRPLFGAVIEWSNETREVLCVYFSTHFVVVLTTLALWTRINHHQAWFALSNVTISGLYSTRTIHMPLVFHSSHHFLRQRMSAKASLGDRFKCFLCSARALNGHFLLSHYHTAQPTSFEHRFIIEHYHHRAFGQWNGDREIYRLKWTIGLCLTLAMSLLAILQFLIRWIIVC